MPRKADRAKADPTPRKAAASKTPSHRGSHEHSQAQSIDSRAVAAALAPWFARHARDLPWRRPAEGTRMRDPYASLVSEFMLQQTQASRVAEKFPLFLARFPTAADLARADEQDVLAAWAGLGYYRRARLLHAAAREIVARFGGRVPPSAVDLISLPGVGRYTAGAVASIAFDAPEPIVDGNVARVLIRLRGVHASAQDATDDWAWDVAADLARAGHEISVGAGVVNEALMELGATVCTPQPRPPACLRCPLADLCVARRQGTAAGLPLPAAAAVRTRLACAAAVITDRDGRVYLQRRSARGLWAGLWQAPTLQSPTRAPPKAALAQHLGTLLGSPIPPAALARVGNLDFTTTHRDVRFTVYAAGPLETPHAAAPAAAITPDLRWAAPADIPALPIGSAQLAVLRKAGLKLQ